MNVAMSGNWSSNAATEGVLQMILFDVLSSSPHIKLSQETANTTYFESSGHCVGPGGRDFQPFVFKNAPSRDVGGGGGGGGG